MERSRHIILFGELLVDNIWAIDSELDEIIADAKAVISGQGAEDEKGQGEAKDTPKAAEAQKVGEGDKATLSQLLKLLLVSPHLVKQVKGV